MYIYTYDAYIHQFLSSAPENLYTHVRYRVAKMHRMPYVAGLFSQKSHQSQGSIAKNDLKR